MGDKGDAYVDLYTPLEYWSPDQVYTWAKYTLPQICRPKFDELNLTGLTLSQVDKKFIKDVLKIEEDGIQNIILNEIKSLKDNVDSKVKFKEEKQKNENNGEMNEDELH